MQTQRAAHDLPLDSHCDISVVSDNGEFRISGGSGGSAPVTEHGMAAALDAVFARLHCAALDRFADHIRIHAASGMGPDGMVLLVGEKRAGKTTLAVHLMLQGFEMLGDEMVLLRNGVAVTFPRRFNLRQSALALLPGLQKVTAGVPDGQLVAVDPLLAGQPWRIRPAPVAAVVFIEPNHGEPAHAGPTRLHACPKLDMVRRVLPQCSPPGARPNTWVADLCRTINRATTVTLSLGDLPSATEAMRGLLTSLPAGHHLPPPLRFG